MCGILSSGYFGYKRCDPLGAQTAQCPARLGFISLGSITERLSSFGAVPSLEHAPPYDSVT